MPWPARYARASAATWNASFVAVRVESSSTREPAYQVLPEIAVDKVTLDQHKMITAGITFS